MFSFTLENILHSNLLNFILMLVILAWIIKKAKIADSIEEGRKLTENKVSNSINEKDNSYKELRDAQLAVDNLEQEVEKVFDSAKNNLKTIEEKIESDAKKQVLTIESNIDRIVISEVNKTKLNLSKGVSNASVKLAQANIEKILESDESLHKKFILDSINEIDKVEL